MTTVTELTLAERREAIGCLVTEDLWQPGSAQDRDEALRIHAHPSLSSDERDTWYAELLDAHNDLWDLDTGRKHWSDVNPYLTCTDCTETAREQLLGQADEAMGVLLHGLNGGN